MRVSFAVSLGRYPVLIPGVVCNKASKLRQYLEPISLTVSNAAMSRATYSARFGSGGSSLSENRNHMPDIVTSKDIGCR